MSFERELNRILKAMQKDIRRTQEAVNELYQQVGSIEADQTMRDLISTQKDLIAHAMGQAQAYTRGIIFGGYAAFFAGWAFAKSVIPPFHTVVSVILITLSIIVFILFEVYKMYISNKEFSRYSINIGKNPQNILALQEEFGREQAEKVIKFQPIWYGNIVWCLATGVGVVIILMWGFLVYLWDAYAVGWNWF